MNVESKGLRAGALNLACVALFITALFLGGAQSPSKENPHSSGKTIVKPGENEVVVCQKCHTSGCPMPHAEGVPVKWATRGRVILQNGAVTCSSCHTPGFKRRSEAFLARDQKGLCSNCHFGDHSLPNAHPFGTPCDSCHTQPKPKLQADPKLAHSMVSGVTAECLRCHYDGPVSHPVGMKNSKTPAPDLPLGPGGVITCVTCHFGHSDQNKNGRLLRKNNRRGDLCLSCHTDL